MAYLPDEKNEQRVDSGDYFQRELYLKRENAAQFLRELADQLETGTELTIVGEDWRFPFEYQEPTGVEIEGSPGSASVLNIKLELTGAQDSLHVD